MYLGMVSDTAFVSAAFGLRAPNDIRTGDGYDVL
jgi:hypothetical protein